MYNKKITYPYAKELLSHFDESETIDISKQKCTKDYAIYVLDTGELDKEAANTIRTLFKSRPNALVYMTAPKNANATFYQLAYLLKVKSVISLKQDVKKVASMIKNAFSTQLQENKSLYVGRFIADALCYMIFKKSELHYASDTLMKNFQCKSLEDVKEKVCSKLDLKQLLSHDSQTFLSGHFFGDEKKLDIVKSIYKNDEYLITVDRFVFEQLDCNTTTDLATRLKFIDFLKERLVEEEESYKYSILTIKITNFKKIGNLIGKSQQEEFIHRFLSKAKELLEKYLMFSEYNHDFFVALYKDVSLKELEKKAQHFYNEMEKFLATFNFKVDIALYIMELDHLELGVVLSILDSIRANKISKKEIRDKKIKYISRFKEDMTDREIVALLLDDSFINDVELTLVNLYKGMLISSPTRILKKERNAIYVIVKQIQGAVMSLEKETIIRSDVFSKDIKARVAYVDRKRKIAKLENFKVLDDNSCYKDSGRVDFAKKNMAILSLVGTKLSAEIIDISVKSIRVKINKIKMIDKMIDKDVEITFSIPTKRTRDGEIKITETAKVSSITCKDDKHCQMVCLFNPESKNKNIILEYVHNRQAEIIEELKKLNY